MAVKEVKLSTIEEALTTPTTAEFNDALKRNRSAFLFRGLPNVSYKLTTSLRWNCKGKAGELEPSILRNFSKYAASTSPRTLVGNRWLLDSIMVCQRADGLDVFSVGGAALCHEQGRYYRDEST